MFTFRYSQKNVTRSEVIFRLKRDRFEIMPIFLTLTDMSRQLHVDLYLPDAKRFKRTLNLFGTIVPEESTFKFFSTKVSILAQWVALG